MMPIGGSILSVEEVSMEVFFCTKWCESLNISITKTTITIATLQVYLQPLNILLEAREQFY